ncbi:MAG TPA: hypothetical protein PLP33_24600 [Leptospiraceae bacterium]|nr:hypothetical protein [Leptospiraceae bacterium]
MFYTLSQIFDLLRREQIRNLLRSKEIPAFDIQSESILRNKLIECYNDGLISGTEIRKEFGTPVIVKPTESRKITVNDKIRFSIENHVSFDLSIKIDPVSGRKFIVISCGSLALEVVDGQTEGNTLELEIDPE